MSYPDVVIACIERQGVSGNIQSSGAALVKHRASNMKKIIPWWLTWSYKTANHSNYLVCDRALRSLSLSQESGKTATQLLQCLVSKWIYNIVLFGGKSRMFISLSLLIDICTLFWR